MTFANVNELETTSHHGVCSSDPLFVMSDTRGLPMREVRSIRDHDHD